MDYFTESVKKTHNIGLNQLKNELQSVKQLLINISVAYWLDVY